MTEAQIAKKLKCGKDIENGEFVLTSPGSSPQW
jgi:hypothetical protein